MGWIGWTEEQTLDTSMPAIELAYEGRLDMLQSIFGGGSEDGAKAAQDLAEPVDHDTVATQLKNALRALAGKKKTGLQ